MTFSYTPGTSLTHECKVDEITYTVRITCVTDFMSFLTIEPPVQTIVFSPNGQITPCMSGTWPLVYTEGYTVRVNGRDVLQLRHERQQSVFWIPEKVPNPTAMLFEPPVDAVKRISKRMTTTGDRITQQWFPDSDLERMSWKKKMKKSI